MKEQIYLDYNATAPMRPEVMETVQNALKAPHNASSVHSFGREGRSLVEKARESVAALCGVPATQIIFNSGATEGNNTVLGYFKDERVLVSAIEHPSVLETALEIVKDHAVIPVTKDGVVDLEALEKLLIEEKTGLVSVMAVNNETGVIQPIQEISALTHKHGALFHCDGVQAAGRILLNMAEMGIDFLSLSAHKIGGPQGVGTLALGLCGITPTLLHGGGQEKRARPGTENVVGISGFGTAAELAQNETQGYTERLRTMQSALEKALNEIGGVIIYGQNTDRVANTTMFSVPGISSETLLMALDLDGIAVSNGSACSSGRVEASHVLKAMGASDEEATGALRISMGWATKESDIEAFLEAFEKIYNRIKSKEKAHA